MVPDSTPQSCHRIQTPDKNLVLARGRGTTKFDKPLLTNPWRLPRVWPCGSYVLVRKKGTQPDTDESCLNETEMPSYMLNFIFFSGALILSWVVGAVVTFARAGTVASTSAGHWLSAVATAVRSVVSTARL